MFRRPSDTNPPSRIATLQVPTKTPTIQRGNVASLIQLHNSRVEGAGAESSTPPRIGTWQRSGTASTIRDVPNNPASSRVPSWKKPPQKYRKDSIAFQNRRTSLAPRQPTVPHGHDTLKFPSSRRTSAVQHQDTHEQSSHPADSFAAQHHEWPPPNITRTDPWTRRASGHRKASLTHGDHSSPLTSRFERPSQSPQPQTPERRESWVRRSLRPPKVQPMSDEAAPVITEPEVQDWSLSRGALRSWATRRTSSEQSRSTFADSRQGLFYGDVSPPHPPVPQVSPAVERPNPWKRRDSSGSVVRSPSPQTRREPLSHRTFERVRSMSPPSINEEFQIHNPSPQRPSDLSIATYITRKLSQQWSDAPGGTLATPSAITRVPPSTPSPRAHHIDSSLVQDILSSIDSVLTEHTTALQTVIKKSHQLLHEKEILCPSVSPRRSPQPESLPIRASSQPEEEKQHSHSSASPKSPTLADPPKLLRRRTTSVPKLLKLIDSTATDMGVPLTDKRDSLTLARELAIERRKSLRRSNSDTDLPTQGDSPASVSAPELGQPSSESPKRTILRMSRKGSIPIAPPRIKVSEEKQPLVVEMPYAQKPFPKIPYQVETQATVEQESMPSTEQRRPTLPTLAILAPFTPSTSVSPLDSVRRLPLSVPTHTTALIPSEEVDESHSSQPRIAPGDYLGSRSWSPEMFTESNMPTPDEPSPLVMEYDRDAALAERATRQSSLSTMPGTTRQNSLQNPPVVPVEIPDPTLVWRNTGSIISSTPEVVMELELVHAGNTGDLRLSRTRTRQFSDPTQKSKRRSSHYNRQRKPKKWSTTHFHSATPSFEITAPDSPEPQVPRTRTSSPMEQSEEVEGQHVPVTEPPNPPAEVSMRSRLPLRSFRERLPSPWQAPESRTESRQVASESGEEHEKPTPDHGPRGQFWTTRSGAEMGKKWFGRHGVGDWGSGHDDDDDIVP